MKNKKIVIGIISLLIVISASFITAKKVQADNLKESFRANISDSNYEEAIDIFSKGKEDKIASDYFNFQQEAKEVIDEQIIKTKDKYINGEADYETTIADLDKLKYFQGLSSVKIEEVVSQLSVIKDSRQAYEQALKNYNEEKYAEAIEQLSKISKEDSKSFQQGKKLKEDLYKQYEEQINEDVEKLVNKNQYSDAIELLSTKATMLTKEEIDQKVEEINEIKTKREEEAKKKAEEERKKAEEASRKRKEELLAKYLKGYVPNPEKEEEVKNESSKTSFLVSVDLKNQLTNVFVGEKGDWKLIKTFNSAAGTASNPTPKGTFTITSRGSWFYSKKYSMGAKYWTRFYGNYLFHSFPMDINRNIVDRTLGKPASHGCIRLSVENAKWIYDNMSYGTKVVIN